MRILEKNGIDNTNIDGAGFNRFCAGDRDGIIKGRLNECAIAVQGNALTIGTGEMLVSGFRVVLDTPTTFTMSSTPTSAQRYQAIAEIVVDGNSEPTFEMRTQLVSELKQDALFATDAGVGTYQIEVCRFTHATDGTISEMSRTVDIITGGSGMELEVGTVETKTVANTEPAAVTVTKREEDGKAYLDFGYDIPRGADGQDGVTPRIGDNKHWYIGEEDTGIVAEGKDGATPEIGENGNWFVNGKDTGKPSKGEKGADGKSVTSATAGTVSEADGYTVTPVTFGLSDGSSLPAVPIKAKNAEVVANPSRDTDNRLGKIDINGTIYNITRIINAVETVSQIYETNLVVGDSITLPRDIVSNTGDLVVAKFENIAPSGGSGVLFAFDEGAGPATYTLLAVISDSAGGGGSGTPVIDLGEVTLTEQELGGVKLAMADGITVSAEQATQAQATSPCIAKVIINGATHEFIRTEISADASAAYVVFTATEDKGGESICFYRLQISIPLTGGTASASLFVFEYAILGGLNSAYKAGGLTFENGVATKTLTEEEVGEWGYNQIRFWDNANSSEQYTLYLSHANTGASLIDSHNYDYFGIVENASVTGEAGGITAFVAYLEDTTLTIKKVALGSGGGGLNVTEISLESSKDAKEIYKTIKTLSETQKIVSILPGANYEGGIIITAVKDGVTKTYVMLAPLFSWTNRGELEITGMLHEMGSDGLPMGTINQATLLYYRTGDTDYPRLIRGGISYEDFENDGNSEKSATILSSSYPLVVYSQEA